VVLVVRACSGSPEEEEEDEWKWRRRGWRGLCRHDGDAGVVAPGLAILVQVLAAENEPAIRTIPKQAKPMQACGLLILKLSLLQAKQRQVALCTGPGPCSSVS